MKGIIKPDQLFFTSIYQYHRAGTEELTAFFKRMLPNMKIGNRPNIKTYGSRFAFMSGCKPKKDFFMFAAQFGHGLTCYLTLVHSPKCHFRGRCTTMPLAAPNHK
jgi:hypothetical protein